MKAFDVDRFMHFSKVCAVIEVMVDLVSPTSKAMGSGSTSSPVQPCLNSQ